ncbi:MAG TPA: hypothetical protein PLK94_14775 [Alphaproteobacteria bacterium]|nr:hypothetical protein [Alphaproteobacteria bacterium]HOO52537.1 hypothetical protein [Alphaproteobacteria bacterium]
MSGLQRFVPNERELLSGVFYRIGYWISHVDDTDEGDESEKIEHDHLIRTLTKISNSPKAGALVVEMAQESLRQEQSWLRWESANDDILKDVSACAGLIKGQGTPEEYKIFSKACMMIATAVAHAFREEPDNMPEAEGYFAWLTEKANTLVLSLTDKEGLKDLSISPEEDNALHELWDVLKS